MKRKSHYLRAYPVWSDRFPELAARRLKWTAMAFAILLTCAAVIAFRILPTSGLGYLLYWFHDSLYLRARGYVWTLHYPYSLVWCVPLGIATATWLGTYLTRRSVVRRPHAWLCRKVINVAIKRQRWSQPLVSCTNTMVRWGFGAELLKEVAHEVHASCFLAAVNGTHPTNDSLTRFVRSTRLLIDLNRTGQPSESGKLRRLALWHQCVLWTDWRLQGSWRDGPSPKLASELASCLDWRIDIPTSESRASQLWADGHDLMDSIESESKGTAERPKDHLALHVTRRLKEVRSLTQHLESGPTSRFASTLSECRGDLATIGVLSVSLALHVALRTGSSSTGVAYIDAFEGLRLAAAINDSGGVTELAAELSDAAPLPEHHKLCAELAANGTAEFGRLALQIGT